MMTTTGYQEDRLPGNPKWGCRKYGGYPHEHAGQTLRPIHAKKKEAKMEAGPKRYRVSAGVPQGLVQVPIFGEHLPKHGI